MHDGSIAKNQTMTRKRRSVDIRRLFVARMPCQENTELQPSAVGKTITATTKVHDPRPPKGRQSRTNASIVLPAFWNPHKFRALRSHRGAPALLSSTTHPSFVFHPLRRTACQKMFRAAPISCKQWSSRCERRNRAVLLVGFSCMLEHRLNALTSWH